MPRDTAFTQQNPYDVLGVSPLDDFTTVRAAWRRLVKTWHPDVWHGSETEATRRMLQVNDAYDRISVIHKRRQAEARDAMAKQDAARKQAQSATQAKARTQRQARVKPRQPEHAHPKAPLPQRTARPNPAQDRFDAARAVFRGLAEPNVQAFA